MRVSCINMESAIVVAHLAGFNHIVQQGTSETMNPMDTKHLTSMTDKRTMQSMKGNLPYKLFNVTTMDTDGRDSLFVNDRPHDDVDHAGLYRCFRPRLAWPGLILLAFIRQNPAPKHNNYLYFLLLLNLNIMITITYIISILISILHSTITRPSTYPT